jgi:DNA replication protein DnaC
MSTETTTSVSQSETAALFPDSPHNPMPELSPVLKQLRLSGILESIDRRNREAIEHKMTYPEFLALVIHDEAARRDQKKYGTRLRRAGFRGDKTLEGFDFDFNPGIDRAIIRDLAACRFINEKVCALIAGPCGTGKSHVAQAIGHCAVRKGIDVMFTTQSGLLSQINAARATGGFERKMQTLARIPLLIIDDFGLKPLKQGQDEDLHDLVAERYERCATIFTSNLDFSEWGDAFPNKLLGAATLDRLRHRAYQVVLDGKSYRSPRPTHAAPETSNGQEPESTK